MKYRAFLILLNLSANVYGQQDEVLRPCWLGFRCEAAFLAEKYPDFRAIRIDLEEQEITIWVKKTTPDISPAILGNQIFQEWLANQIVNPSGINSVESMKDFKITYQYSSLNFKEWEEEYFKIREKLSEINPELKIIEWDLLFFYKRLHFMLTVPRRVLDRFSDTSDRVVIKVPANYTLEELTELNLKLQGFALKPVFGTFPPAIITYINN